MRRLIENLAQLGEGPQPQFFNAVLGPFHPTSDFGEGQALDMAKEQDVPVVGRKLLESVGEEHSLFPPDCLLAW